MSVSGWIFFLAFVIQAVAFESMSNQRDEIRADLGAMTALYNGVLIGRGCEIPE